MNVREKCGELFFGIDFSDAKIEEVNNGIQIYLKGHQVRELVDDALDMMDYEGKIIGIQMQRTFSEKGVPSVSLFVRFNK